MNYKLFYKVNDEAGSLHSVSNKDELKEVISELFDLAKDEHFKLKKVESYTEPSTEELEEYAEKGLFDLNTYWGRDINFEELIGDDLAAKYGVGFGGHEWEADFILTLWPENRSIYIYLNDLNGEAKPINVFSGSLDTLSPDEAVDQMITAFENNRIIHSIKVIQNTNGSVDINSDALDFDHRLKEAGFEWNGVVYTIHAGNKVDGWNRFKELGFLPLKKAGEEYIWKLQAMNWNE